jgi:hypothetical protein
MPRAPLHTTLVWLLLAALLPACTDWNAQGNVPAETPRLQQLASTQPGDAGATDALPGLTVWETWTPPPVDAAIALEVAPGDDATATQDGGDATESTDDADLVDVQVVDVPVVDVAVVDVAVVDVPLADVDPACVGNAKGFGCPCASSSQCGSGLCTLGPAGPVCSQTCAKTGCPEGWACVAPSLVCKPVAVPDAGLDTVEVADTTGDAANPDGLDDAVSQDVSAEVDVGIIDTAEPDAGITDTVQFDVQPADVLTVDVSQPDATTSDIFLPVGGGPYCPCGSNDDCASGLCIPVGSGSLVCADPCNATCPTGWACTGYPGPGGTVVQVCLPALPIEDVSVTDSTVVDATSNDSGSDSSSGDGLGVDWQGYPDANFPDGADIYGGPINSCLSVYLFQQENCGKNSPTSACITEAGQSGSLYANFLYEPFAACQKAVCVPQCVGAADGTCMEKCIGKYCATQFLTCVANDSSGASDCPTAFTCAGKYPDKLLTIASACYANATPTAQKQMAALIGCSGAPQTSSCLPEIAACYKSANPQASCKDVATCTGGCGSDQSCVWTCIGTASPAALQKIQALGDCQNTCKAQCSGSQTCVDACNQQQCGGQVADCLAN